MESDGAVMVTIGYCVRRILDAGSARGRTMYTYGHQIFTTMEDAEIIAARRNACPVRGERHEAQEVWMEVPDA
jgi:hypothetical protein